MFRKALRFLVSVSAMLNEIDFKLNPHFLISDSEELSRLYRDTDLAFIYPVGYFEVLMTDL